MTSSIGTGCKMTFETIDPRGSRGVLGTLRVRQRADALYRSHLKRMLDIVIVLAAAPIAVPVVAGLAAVALAQGTSPFYSQPRLGRGGREFRIVKIRTMVADADAALEAHLARDAQAREEWERTQKLRQDPRVTRFGCALRRSSLDELPQLWNVLLGHMSIVGPRPMMVSQKALYPGTAYFELRPGITGPWQVSKRNASSFADRAAFDTEYHERLSIWTDLAILSRTMGVVLRGTGC